MNTLELISTDNFAKIKGGDSSLGMFYPTGYVVAAFEKTDEAH